MQSAAQEKPAPGPSSAPRGRLCAPSDLTGQERRADLTGRWGPLPGLPRVHAVARPGLQPEVGGSSRTIGRRHGAKLCGAVRRNPVGRLKRRKARTVGPLLRYPHIFLISVRTTFSGF